MKRLAIWGFLGAFVVQTGLLAWLIVDRALLLKNGKEITLKVIPVDPRDLFRGDYVVLSYDISRLDAGALEGDDGFSFAEPIYVSIREGAEGWEARAIHREPPEGDALFLRGHVYDVRSGTGQCDAAECPAYMAEYNLEQFFVPEGKGRELETLRNDQRMSVDVAVAENGRSALKRLLVDGEVRYEEQLY
jgi:uncharacterized membrane-anchored protein